MNNGKRGADEVLEPHVVGNKKHRNMQENIHCSSHQQKEAEQSPFVKLAANTQDAKQASNSNVSMQEDEDNTTSKENAIEFAKKSVEVPPAIKSSAPTHDDAERVSIFNEYKEVDRDDCSKDHQHLETQNISARLDLESERTEHHPTHGTGSKTLFLGNLSFLIEEDDVDFFKNAGEIANIRFAIKDDRFLGYGHIEFTTAEAAQEALKLNKEVLLDRRVTLDITRRQRGAYTPGNSMDKSNQRGGPAQVKTVYVRGFESSEGFDDIRNALEKHFKKCGEISRLSIPKDHVSGAPRGVAFIEFTDGNGFHEALKLDGSEVGGRKLTVEEAKKPRGEDREVSGYGGGGSYVRERGSSRGGWSGSYGSRGGSSGNHVRESGFGGGSRGSWSGSAGSFVRESGSGGGRSGSYVTESGSDGGRSGSYVRESGSGGGRSGYGGNHVRESGYGSGWSRSGGGWRRESGYGSRLRTESGYGSLSHTESGSSGASRRESSYGRGGGGWGWGRGSGSNDGGFNSSGVNSGGGSGSNHRVGSFYGGSRRGGRP